METNLPDEQVSPLCRYIARNLGLHFPALRQADLDRGVTEAARDLGYQDPVEFVRILLSTSPTQSRTDALARHLTVGETYFFRERRCFDVLTKDLIPSLLRCGRGRQRLRIWSAGCCTGEEPYSIAIALCQALGGWCREDISILATDLNPAFLKKAEAGVYGQWSFRDAPPGIQRDFFRPTADGRFQVVPEIRRMVQFAQLNMVDDVYPSPSNDTESMDVIFCRNMLMYFNMATAKRVVQNLCKCQVDDGWLLASATEAPDLLCGGYQRAGTGDVIYYQKTSGKIAAPPALLARATMQNLPLPDCVPQRAVREKKRPVGGLGAMGDDPKRFGALARSLADQGKLCEALHCCDRWILADKLNPAGHYLRSIILQEQNALDTAVQSLVKAIYLDPEFTLAHFALGSITRHCGRMRESRRHLNNALVSLRRFNPADILPESDGVSAGRLAEIIDALQKMEVAA